MDSRYVCHNVIHFKIVLCNRMLLELLLTLINAYFHHLETEWSDFCIFRTYSGMDHIRTVFIIQPGRSVLSKRINQINKTIRELLSAYRTVCKYNKIAFPTR